MVMWKTQKASNINKSTINMKKSTKFLIPTLALTILSVAGAVGISTVSAHGFGRGEGRDSFTQSLSEKFNLNEGEVNSFLEEKQVARQEERKTEREEHLSGLVSEGKLTGDQKTAMINKMEENQAEKQQNRDQFKDMTREERQAERQEHRDEMDQWFEEQGIDKDESDLRGEMGEGHGGRGGNGLGK